MKEVWKDVPGYEGYYQASSSGNIRSCDRITTARNADGSIIYRNYLGRIKTITLKSSGYCQVTLAKNNIHKRELVHRLIALTFIPNPCNKLEINHKNGNKIDNNMNNLEWATSSENQIHANRVLHKQDGENHPISKFTNAQVIKIRKAFKIGLCNNYAEMARIFGVDSSTIRRIVLKITYKNAEIY